MNIIMSDNRRKFLYRGHTLEELNRMNMKKFAELIPARQRRSLKRGMPGRQKKLIQRLKKAKKIKKKNGKDIIVRTHVRDMIVFPEFIGLTVAVYNGVEFIEFTITPEHIGHYFGEFSPATKPVNHGRPGVGATRSSRFVPLK